MTESNDQKSKALSGPVEDWTELQGVAVRITKNGQFVRSGQVEAVTPSGDVLWLQGMGVELREMFDRNEGHEAWLKLTADTAASMGTTAYVYRKTKALKV